MVCSRHGDQDSSVWLARGTAPTHLGGESRGVALRNFLQYTEHQLGVHR